MAWLWSMDSNYLPTEITENTLQTHRMSVEVQENEIILTHKGSSVRVLLFGATILSWVVEGKEQLWLSEKAHLDGSKAVRGGIPLVFPVFGKATEGPCAKLPQHGFARNNTWQFLGQVSDSPLVVEFGLGPEDIAETAREQWPHDFTLVYRVTLDGEAKTLSTAMTVENTDSAEWEFNVLFHTYFRIPAIDKVRVVGLESVHVNDKVSKSQYEEAEAGGISFSGELDRVYENATASEVVVEVDGKPLHVVKRSKEIGDVVVWNPWTANANALTDFWPKSGYQQMVCVEAGSVSKWNKLSPGNKWTGSQIIYAKI